MSITCKSYIIKGRALDFKDCRLQRGTKRCKWIELQLKKLADFSIR